MTHPCLDRPFLLCFGSNDEVAKSLKLHGLAEDAPLSVLAVDILPRVTDIFEHGSVEQPEIDANIQAPVRKDLRTSSLTELPVVSCPTCK